MATGMVIGIVFIGPVLFAAGLMIGWSCAANRNEQMPATGLLMLPPSPYSAPVWEGALAVVEMDADPEATRALPAPAPTAATGPRHRAP